MQKKTMETLEFAKVRALFEPFLETQQGQQALGQLEPVVRVDKMEQAFAHLTEMGELFVHYPHFGVGATKDISSALARLRVEADLSLAELVLVKAVLSSAKQLRDFYDQVENVQLTSLTLFFDKLEVLPHLQGALQAVNDAGFLEDFASEELLKIRRKIHGLERDIRQLMQDFLKTKSEMLTDTVLASRNGRNVLPVKNTYRNRIAGVVHDISASGSTVYIEPRAAVSLNEDLTNAHAEERHEIARIVHELSELLRPHREQISNQAWVIGQLDLVRAKHLFARQYGAVVPAISTEKDVALLNVRHPLLAEPVANDLYFNQKTQAILITGPNTGGKTIMLKTLGLTHLMAQAGLPVLADSGSRVAVFSDIFADIGDEQSIEQSLSTFSSHMTNTVSILEQADADALVLFDELGAGTDPQEGASLAMAILEHLRSRGIKTMATTHYPELKAYGIETSGIENASMEFDTQTLRPTYRFLQGVPGRSNAFEIAKRLGLSEGIVAAAQGFTSEDSDVNRIIEELESQTLESRKRLETIREVEQENFKMNRALKKLYNELTRERENELNKARLEAQEIVDLALAESEEILKTLHDKSQLKPHEIIDAKGQLKKLAPAVVDLSQNKVLKKAKEERKAKVGDDIIVTAYGQRGTLTKELKDGRFEAQVGLIKMTLSREEFGLVHAEKEQEQKKERVNVVKKTAGKAVKARLDLRGKRYEEAMLELDDFIDQALLNNLAQVDIIHGIGTGVIREGVTKYLRRNKQVKDFGYAPQNAGGPGATIVTFK